MVQLKDTMNKKTIFYVVGGIFILFLFLLGVYKLTNTGSSPQSYADITVVKPTDHTKWAAAGKNVLVEYSDFQCPACRNFHSILRSFEASGSSDFKITQKVTFVYRHFPLPQHSNAIPAAYASEAAGKQGKFFEMEDLLFNTQDQWSTLGSATDFFVKLARDLNLDIERFKSDMNGTGIKQKVRDDTDSGTKVQIDRTPTFFLNGTKLEIQSIEQFKKLLSSLP